MATNMTLRELAAFAYSPTGLMKPFPPVDGPNWIDVDYFDVVGRVVGHDPSGTRRPPQLAMMVRALLAQRFALRAHHESRALPVYGLLLARRDRTIGPRLRPATVGCLTHVAALRAARTQTPPSRVPAHGPCVFEGGGRYLESDVIGMRGVISTPGLAAALSNPLNRVVRDQTELDGLFEIDLTWASAQAPSRTPTVLLRDPNNASIFASLKEQLGLKLTATEGAGDVLVIDRASRPRAGNERD